MSRLARVGRAAMRIATMSIAMQAAPLAAQNSAAHTARANVVTSNVVVTGLTNLDFGVILAGSPATVLPTDPTAGSFNVTGDPNRFVTMTFTLPTVLNNITFPGPTMPIAFGPTSAIWLRGQVGPPGTGNPFDPSVSTVGRLGPPPRPFMRVWIGGTATPASAQAQGLYTGSIVLTVVYF